MSSPRRMFTIVVASGRSQRFGSNKLAEWLNGETVLERSVRIAKSVSDGVVVVTDPESFFDNEVYAIVAGGDTRSTSVRCGLAVIPDDIEIIAVHDGARPGATSELYDRGRTFIETGALAAIPVVNVVDTIKEVENDIALHTLDRSSLRAVQTPQIFDAQTLRRAYDSSTEDTDDAALVEALGIDVITFDGSIDNRKITTPDDLVFFRKSRLAVPRIGTGYDIHPFSKDEDKRLVLGCTEVDFVGLEGHSDSDAVAHALTDALLSAIGEQDLGTLFPASDPAHKNASSRVFLEKAVTLVGNAGYVLGNATIIINAQQPKLGPHVDAMNKNISEVCAPIATSETQISLTPKHGEGIGEIGRGEAIAVYATVLLHPTH